MKKLTALQQLIAFLKQTPMMHSGILQMIEDAKLLETEKDNIKGAYRKGSEFALDATGKEAEKYFETTFNQE